MGGATQSINEVNQTVTEMTQVVSSTIQGCGVFSNVSQVISVYQDCLGSNNVDISHVRFSSLATVDLKCVQSASAQQSVTTAVTQDAQQMATAIAGFLGLDLSSQEAKNIAKLSMDVATSISNSFAQTASAAVSANQGIYIHQTGQNCNTTLNVISFDSIQDTVVDVIQHTSVVQSAVTNLIQEIKQVASAKVTSILEKIAIFVVALVAVVLGGGALLRAAKRTPTTIVVRAPAALPAGPPPVAARA
jgi:carbon monoxide dehydrogenase subunit G